MGNNNMMMTLYSENERPNNHETKKESPKMHRHAFVEDVFNKLPYTQAGNN